MVKYPPSILNSDKLGTDCEPHDFHFAKFNEPNIVN